MFLPTLLLIGLSSLLVSVSGAAISPNVLLRRANSGQATFYGGNLAGGNCMFSTLTLPAGVYGTASANWDNSAHCGACVSVKGPKGNSITAMVVDQCPGCGTNHLDLFPDAFKALADPSVGVIPITWSYVTCPIKTPLQLHCKSGASQYWFSVQVVGATKAVKSLEVGTGGKWLQAQRQDYNYFQLSSAPGSATVNVRVTSVDGDVVVVNGVTVASDASITASTNF